MRRALAALALAVLLPWPALAGSYTVQPGDTLSGIAARYGVSVDRLIQLNGLKSANDLQIGSKLVVPGAGGGATSAGRRGAGGGTGGSYMVKSGDTLSEIADRYGVSVDRLIQLNGLKSANDLQAGSKLVVPGAAGGSRGGSSQGGGSASGSYTVKEGDTLTALAERYGVSVDRLIQLNGLKSADDLQAGSKLVVPGPNRPPSVAASKSKPPTIAKGAKVHQVKAGETLSQISDASGVSMERLIALNNLKDPNHIPVGSSLKLRSDATASAPAASKPKPESKPEPVAKPPVKPAPAVAKAPSSAAKPPSAAKPVAKATGEPAETSTAPAMAAKPEATKPEPVAKPEPMAKPEPVAKPVVAVRPATVVRPDPAARPAPAATAAKPTAVAKANAPDWRTYGPLQVDWANWQPMGGSYVAPSLNSQGQPLYLAINCTARKLNATGQSGAWKTWDAPQTDFENQLVKDLCRAKGL